VRRVVVTSVVRYPKPHEISGHLRIVDLERGRVSYLTPVPESGWRFDDPNPRGGTRGTCGVSVCGGRLALVNAERLFVFDTSWRLVCDSTEDRRLMEELGFRFEALRRMELELGYRDPQNAPATTTRCT